MSNEPEKDALLKALAENWLHARHAESERLWFTNIYALIVAGVLGFAGRQLLGFETLGRFLPFAMFLLALSLLGFLLVRKLNAEFVNHVDAIKRICQLPKIGLIREKPGAEPDEYMALPLGMIRKCERIRPGVSDVFRWFYIIMLVVWSALFIAGIVSSLIY